MDRLLGAALAAVAFSACAPSPRRPPAEAVPVETWGPSAGVVPRVSCTEHPSERQVVVTCRYFDEQQMAEVWRRSVEHASVVAVSLGFSHVQWLALEKRTETVRSAPTPVDCKRRGWENRIECTGGQSVAIPVAGIAATRFTFLHEDEAAVRSSDPLIPAERRPVDAREQAASTRKPPKRAPAAGAPPADAAPPAPPAAPQRAAPPAAPGAGAT